MALSRLVEFARVYLSSLTRRNRRLRWSPSCSAEVFEPRILLTRLVLTEQVFHFTDADGNEQTINVSGGRVRVKLSELEDGRHEIDRIRVLDYNVSLSVSTNVERLIGRGLATGSIDGDVNQINLHRLSGDLTIAGDVGRARIFSTIGQLQIDGNLTRANLGQVDGDLVIGGSVLGIASARVLKCRVILMVGFAFVTT